MLGAQVLLHVCGLRGLSVDFLLARRTVPVHEMGLNYLLPMLNSKKEAPESPGLNPKP